MITLKQYHANSEVLHSDYFAQFVTPDTLRVVKSRIGLDKIQASTDPALNDIPLRLWDNLPMTYNRQAMKDAGDYLTQSSHVCIMKTAARLLLATD